MCAIRRKTRRRVMLTALGLTLEEILQGNIDKLRARYPEGFSEERSRNR